MNFKKVLLIVCISFVSSIGFASWMCEGQCDTTCFRGTLSRSGATEYNARSAMNDGCNEIAAANNCNESPNAIIHRCFEQGGGIPSAPSPTSYKILLRNNCNKHGKIWSAVHYRDLAGTWQTNGYWGISFGETVHVGNTTNRIFFTHGHTDNNVVWGDGYAKLNVRGEEQPFSKQTISENNGFGPYIYSFGCN